MTRQDFIDQVDGWAEELLRIAETGVDCSDPEIADICYNYVFAERKLLSLLDDLGVELG